MKRREEEDKKAALVAYAEQLGEEEKSADRQSAAKKNKQKRTAKTVMLSVVTALSVGAIAGLSVALAYSENMNRLRAEYMYEMEGVYTRHYYDLADSADELDVNLGKLAAADTAAAQQDILYDIWGAANLAGVSLSAFRGGEEGVMQASKFVGQTGDYAHYLAKRLESGEPLSPEELQKLGKLREMTRVLKSALESTRSGVREGRPFLGDGGMLAEFTGAFDSFVDPEVNYPQMIYDGPFSDALEHRECKALKGLAEIDPDEGARLLAKYIPEAKSVEYRGETNSDILTYNYSVTTEDGVGFAQLAKQGGMLVAYNMNAEQSAVAEVDPELPAAARRFAENAGFGDLAVVWCASAQGVTYVNLTPVKDGALLYPDLIKVKLDESSGRVTGLDAMHYVFNHTDRTLPSPVLTAEEAAEKVPLPTVGGGRLALIPMDETREVLTYEFECESDGTYFVYIDAATGEEVNILYVVNDVDRGALLM